jgi:hypothetical protein
VQNGYYLPHRSRASNDKDIDFAYQNAHTILSISEDTTRLIQLTYPELSERILRLYCSIDAAQFHCNEQKENVISYMPRKNRMHAENLIFILKKKLAKHWRVVAIDNVTHEEAAQILRKSRIFLSFSELEGLGLPPIEAALSGNYVIGYHGNGGLEYWLRPNFEAVADGDLGGFLEKIQTRVAQLDQANSLDELNPGIIKLQNIYSLENEKKYLLNFVEQIKLTKPEKNGDALSIKLQKRQSLFHSLLRSFYS